MKLLFAAVTAILLAFAPFTAAAAQLVSPEGVWELEFRDSHFRVAFCEGDALCGTLIWLSPSSSTPDKTKYLGQLVVKYAKPAGENRWQGEMDLLGEHVDGIVEQLSDNELTLTGCKYYVFCRSYHMYRLAPGASPADRGK